MKLLLTCACVVLSVAVATADEPTKIAKGDKASCLDGTWKVLSAEKNGEAVADAKDMTVTVADNVITCNCAKTGTTMKIEITGPGKGRVTTTAGKGERQVAKGGDEKETTKDAVFVLTSQYLAVCVHDEHRSASGEAKPRDADAHYKPSIKDQCTVVLKRTDSAK